MTIAALKKGITEFVTSGMVNAGFFVDRIECYALTNVLKITVVEPYSLNPTNAQKQAKLIDVQYIAKEFQSMI